MPPLADVLSAAFDPSHAAARFTAWIPNLVVAVLSLVVFWLFHRAVDRAASFVMRRAHMDETASAFLRNVLRYAIAAVALVTALGQLGVDVSSILASLGVVGLTVGFAARDALSNVIAGLFIFWDRPFVLGDYVEIAGAYGRVDEITMRSTRVVTPDGKMLAIPNSTVVNTTVVSYTNFPNLRLDIALTVGPAEDLDRLRDLFAEVLADRTEYLPSPAPEVVLVQVGDYNLTVEFRAWLRDEKTHLVARPALREAIYTRLRAAEVDMPLETVRLVPSEVASGIQVR